MTEEVIGEEVPEDLKQVEGKPLKLQMKIWNGDEELEVQFEILNTNFDVPSDRLEQVVSTIGGVAFEQLVDTLRSASSPLILPGV